MNLLKRDKTTWPDSSADPLTFEGFAGPHGRMLNTVGVYRRGFLMSVVLNAFLGGSVIWLATQAPAVETVAVVFDPYGRIENVVGATGFEPDERMVGHWVLKYIECVRGVSSDRVLLRRCLVEVNDMTTDRGREMVRKAFEADPWGLPSQIPENRVRQVDRIRVMPPTEHGSATYTATWREQDWEHGRLVETRDMWGAVALTRRPGENVEAVKRNPLGLWVDSIRWQEN